jgi:hypothetical protein
MLEGDMRIFCSPNMNIMPVYFAIDVKSRLVTKMNLVGKSLLFSILARILRQNSCRMAKSSGSEHGPTEVFTVS